MPGSLSRHLDFFSKERSPLRLRRLSGHVSIRYSPYCDVGHMPLPAGPPNEKSEKYVRLQVLFAYFWHTTPKKKSRISARENR